MSYETNQIDTVRFTHPPIALRRFHGILVPERYYNTINNLRNSWALYNKIFFVDQIPYKEFDEWWIKRKFNFEDADRYSRITENLIKEMWFDIIRIFMASKNVRLSIFKETIGNELRLLQNT